MTIALIGLGRMGGAVAYRLTRAGFSVVGYDIQKPDEVSLKELNIIFVESFEQLAQKARLFWLMVPHEAVDETLAQLMPNLKAGDVVIDGGNSFWRDSQRRAKTLLEKNIIFFDCGVSGGIHGKEQGFSLMLGGDKQYFEQITPVVRALAAPQGFGLVGPSGAGHYVKMIHNGIEYGLLEAYAEGFQVLKLGSFKKEDLDLAQITDIWQHGAVIRSWILQLSHEILKKDQQFSAMSGAIEEHGTGRWTLEEASTHKISVPVIEESLNVRAWSRKTGGNYGTKIIAMLRNVFGGHKVEKM